MADTIAACEEERVLFISLSMELICTHWALPIRSPTGKCHAIFECRSQRLRCQTTEPQAWGGMHIPTGGALTSLCIFLK